ncbi:MULTISPECIES: acyl-CoA synthetase [unclassified Methylophilus]|uniref:acyl-CoA synthetase n=1 Tax=unclassified Methylophilus TaxID=2630143 RepID=UPI0006FCBEEB|nr:MULTISPECIES: acyl-CoA synthetase [unclassified Methylophilus]KQT37157.1 acetyl-CoA synthetase [Methylophilus sp. Leaf416]KQT55672.1 acetyl-CoA synthetase [Methylophilus sp. Leaf459]
MTQLAPYPQWQWDIPELFNIGVACSDRHLGTAKAGEIAMIVEDDTFGTSTITFAELAEQTDRFAQVLRDLGVTAGDRILIRLPNSLDYPIAFLGAMKTGAISVPTSTLLTAEEVAYLAKDSGAVVLVTDAAAWATMSAKMQENIAQTPNLKHILLTQLTDEAVASTVVNVLSLQTALAEATEAQAAYATRAEDPAYLVYTSGTTGYPKGVLHAHRALLGRQPAADYWFNYSDQLQDRIMHSGKFNWTYVLGTGLMDPLYLGKTVIVHEGKNDAQKWLDLIAKHKATIFIGVPTIYRQLLQKTTATQADIPSVRHYMSAGEHLSDEVLVQWRERFGLDIYEAVGMSEFSYYLSQSIYRPIRAGSAGFPQPGHDLVLLNPETREPVAAGEEGMICVPESDPGLFLSYWNLPEETVKYKHDGYFFTGDYAKYDADGYIWFLGRKDDIIKSFGYRVSPYEIERVYKGHPAVADCAAIGEEIEKDKLLVVIYVIPKPECEVQADELIAFGKQHLAAYKTPKTVYLAKEFPRTKNGKILRKDVGPAIAYMKSNAR